MTRRARRARPARGADPAAARVPEVQGRRRAAGRAARSRGATCSGAGVPIDADDGPARRSAEHSVWKLIEAFGHPGEGRQARVDPRRGGRPRLDRRSHQPARRPAARRAAARSASTTCFDLTLPEAELRNQVVVTLLAILELARLKVVRVLQSPRRRDPVRHAGRAACRSRPRARRPRRPPSRRNTLRRK